MSLMLDNPQQLRRKTIFQLAGFLFLLLSCTPLSAQQTNALTAGSTLDRAIKGGETQWFTLKLAEGDFAEVKIEQKGVDVEVALVDPSGKQLARMDSPNADWGPEPVVVIAHTDGEYKLRVTSSAPANTAPGNIALELVAQHKATAQDEMHVSAERAVERAYDSANQHDANALSSGETSLNEALRYYQSSGDRYRLGIVLTSLGLSRAQENDFKGAIGYYRRGLTEFQAIGNPHMQALSLSNIATGLDIQGDYSQALRSYQQALSLLQGSEETYNQALILNNIGKLLIDSGDWQNAADYFDRALPLARTTGDLPLLASILHNTGDNHLELGQPEKALPYLQEEKSTAGSLKNPNMEARALDSIGWAYMAQGDSGRALDSYQQALALQTKKGDKRRQALTLRYIALVYLSLGKDHEALNELNNALLLLKETDDRRNEALTREVLGEAYGRTSQPEQALEAYHQALNTFEAIGDRSQQAKTLAGIARIQRTQGNMEEALRNSSASLALIEGLRARASQQDRTSYFATQQDLYNFQVDLLMQMNRQHPSAGYDAQAFQSTERARARSLLEMLAESRVDFRQGVEPRLLERERDLSSLLNAKSQRLLSLRGAGGSEQANALKKEINDLENEYQQTQQAIRKSSPAYASLTQPQPLTLQEVQQRVLDSDSLLLEYSVGQEHSYLFAVSGAGLKTYELPGRAEIDKAVRQLYQLLTARSEYRVGETPQEKLARITRADRDYPAAAAALSKMILAPAAPDLGEKRLIVVADGGLQTVPFAVLPALNAPGSPPLVVQHELVSLPSASTADVLRQEIQRRQPPQGMVAVLADPVFAADDPRVHKTASEGREHTVAAVASPDARENDSRMLAHLAGSSSSGSAHLEIPRLPFTRQEAVRIAKLVPADTSFEALDFKASLPTVEGGILSRYRYVHFATHGYLDSERPELSSIVLSLVDQNGHPQNGLLRAQDIYNLKLNADLVVLSACQTGLGKEIRGEGIVGLTRGFMYAGAPRVIVSLWSVNDRATEELMATFYQKLLKENLRPSAALRQAQVELWKSRKWSSPYYWGAFIQQGEWR